MWVYCFYFLKIKYFVMKIQEKILFWGKSDNYGVVICNLKSIIILCTL